MYSTRSLPLAISHRGLRHAAPENSIPAFLAAIEAGAEAVELDVHASNDGMIYVHHDFSVSADEGDAATPRPLAGMQSGEISKLKLAEGVSIPKLDDVLEAIGTRAGIFIEIKAAGIETDVVRCLRRHSAGLALYAIHAFDHRIARRMLELIPTVRTGILQVAYPIDSCAVMRAAGASDLWQHADFVDSSLVADVHACGGRVIVWTANEQVQWRALAAAGVDAVCTDRVDEYVAWRTQEEAH